MTIYDILKKKKSLKNYKNTKEYSFYQKHKKEIKKVSSFYHLKDEKDDGFFILESNILIEAFLSKKYIEEIIINMKDEDEIKIVDEIKNMLEKRPYIEKDGEKIYLPQFPKALNYIYLNNPSRLILYPYNLLDKSPSISCVDLFDEFGYEIFNSSFVNLHFILKDATSKAFYSDSFESIYIINDQGRLDLVISVFDKYLENKNKDNINERLLKVMTKFYENNLTQFVKALKDEKFISEKMHRILIKNISKKRLKRVKRIAKG